MVEDKYTYLLREINNTLKDIKQLLNKLLEKENKWLILKNIELKCIKETN